MSIPFGIAERAGFNIITGESQPSSMAHDSVDEMEGGFDYLNGSGEQHSEHPAKNQPKTMRPLG